MQSVQNFIHNKQFSALENFNQVQRKIIISEQEYEELIIIKNNVETIQKCSPLFRVGKQLTIAYESGITGKDKPPQTR
jgi:hypothetical protein